MSNYSPFMYKVFAKKDNFSHAVSIFILKYVLIVYFQLTFICFSLKSTRRRSVPTFMVHIAQNDTMSLYVVYGCQ
jgi:hypothetical protein